MPVVLLRIIVEYVEVCVRLCKMCTLTYFAQPIAGILLRQWMRYPSSEERLGVHRDVASLAVSEGVVYVVEAPLSYVRSFSSEGAFLGMFGRYGSADGELIQPCAIAAKDGQLFVSDWANHCIQVFEHDGKFIHRIGICDNSHSWSSDEFCCPQGLCFRGQRLYVADRMNDRIQVFEIHGNQREEDNKRNGCKPNIKMGKNKRKRKREKREINTTMIHHSFLFSIVGQHVHNPSWLGVNAQGLLYMTSYGDDGDQIKVFDNTECVRTWVKAGYDTVNSGHGEGRFLFLNGIIVGADERVYVCDSGNAQVQVFRQDGTFVHQWETRNKYNPFAPYGLAFGGDGDLFVAGPCNIAVYV